MDVFLEKIVKKKKASFDYFIIGVLITVGLYLSIFFIYLLSFGVLLDALMIMGLYYFIKGRNIEYEYAVTNGDVDIDKIIGQRKRKRMFSANCKDFEILARVSHEKFSEAKKIENRIVAISSKKSPDIYFIILHYNEKKTLVLFEPDERMIKALKTYAPRKVFE